MLNILIKGCGIAGLTVAWELAKYGCKITFYAPEISPINSASWFAGGMLAPFCERESAPEIVQKEGVKAIKWWRENFSHHVISNGTLVLTLQRDFSELERFAKATSEYNLLQTDDIEKLEPNLSGRFNKALFYENEAHIDPREILLLMKHELEQKNVVFLPYENKDNYDFIIDCTGINYAKQNKDLRGVRGEMLLVKCKDISINRTIRLLHPRIPLYVVPRANNIFMIGATMIESSSDAPILCRSMMEMLNCAYMLHPAFAGAQILESGVGIRPAFPDNLPKIEQNSNHISINGFYRHGFLLSPYIANNIVNLLIKKA